jgi:hypothetical protein
MRLGEVEAILLASGAAPHNFHVGSEGADDALVLVRDGERFRIGYAERGRIREVLAEHDDEDAACRDFVDRVLSIRHLHLVGMFADEATARATADRLGVAGIPVQRDAIPFGPCDVRHRVFVEGTDIHRAREVLGGA